MPVVPWRQIFPIKNQDVTLSALKHAAMERLPRIFALMSVEPVGEGTWTLDGLDLVLDVDVRLVAVPREKRGQNCDQHKDVVRKLAEEYGVSDRAIGDWLGFHKDTIREMRIRHGIVNQRAERLKASKKVYADERHREIPREGRGNSPVGVGVASNDMPLPSRQVA